jgi:SAM-dependent methyltransferase
VYVNRIPDGSHLEDDVSASVVYTNDQLAKRPFFRRRAHELLADIETRQGGPGRLLDVGCGIGTELAVAGERGWRATGIELATESLRVARESGLDIVAKPIAEAGLADTCFDLVTVNHALEHIPRVREALGEMRRVLRPAGLLFIAVPNLAAWPHRVRLDRFALAFNPDHYLFFTRDTLGRLLTRAGFTVLELETPRWIDFQRAPAQDYAAPFRVVNGVVEWLGMGLEIFALAQVT